MSIARRVVAEDLVLDLFDLVLDRLQHRHVVVDDEVEDRVEDVVLAVRQHAGQHSQRSRTARVGGRGAVAHRDHVALADEEMRLAEGDAVADHLRGARDDEGASPYCSIFGG